MYVTGDPSERDLRELLEERLKRVGNQVVVGAEVDVVIGKATLDGLNYLDIARKLNCARLVIASTASNVSDYNQYSFAVDTAMSLTMVDLNSGRTIMKRNTNTGCTVGKLRSWRKARRDNVEFCIASVFGGS